MAAVRKANYAISLIVKELSNKYGFDQEEAMNFLIGQEKRKDTISVKEKKEGAPSKKGRARRIPLPWLGKINTNCCRALNYNLGLYTQCENSVHDTEYCITCCSKKEEYGEFPHGTVSDRMEANFEGKNGKPVISYGNILEKKKILKADVLNYAMELDIVIPEELFCVVKKPRGRPKKEQSVAVNDSSDEDAPKKKRGRPKKAVVIDNQDGILGAILNPSFAKKEETKEKCTSNIISPLNRKEIVLHNQDTSSESGTPVDTESDVEEIEGVEMIHNGIKYFKTDSNELYDPDTEEHVANWDPDNANVVPI